MTNRRKKLQFWRQNFLQERRYRDWRPAVIWGSAHPEGFYVAMCDGSVDLVSYDIEHAVHLCNGHRADEAANCAEFFGIR